MTAESPVMDDLFKTSGTGVAANFNVLYQGDGTDGSRSGDCCGLERDWIELGHLVSKVLAGEALSGQKLWQYLGDLRQSAVY